ncbi:MAG: hypothetical protein J3R72DRAFT_422288 [Linnemannia gamsii]|nr:MAG: hypothetical protein J3R72DRAFT_422288 [Linnemannia gamsii]
MAFNFDDTFSLDQPGLELSLNDFSFDPTQANLQQQHQQQLQQLQQHQQQQQQEQQDQHRELHNLLLQDDSNNSNNGSNGSNGLQAGSINTVPVSSGAFDFHPSALSTDMMVPASASTTPIFQTNPDKIAHTDYTQYMSPLGIAPAPDTTDAAAMVITDQFDDDEVFFTPLISPAMTPSHPYSNLPHALSTANEIFSPLTSPALQPHRTSAIDYLSFSGQSFSPLPMQLHQAQSAQQQLQQQLQQLQSQPQPDLSQQQQQQQQTQQNQQQLQFHQQQSATSQASGSKPLRIDVRSPALNAQQQRPPMKRKTTVERVTNGLAPTVPRSTGPVRVALSKNSPAMRPIASPMSPATLRKQQATRPRSSPIAPASPLIMHFPTNRPSPSPLLISTAHPTSGQISQASPSPRLVTNMHHLSMVPSSPLGIVNLSNGPLSPALFALPASSMMPPPRSPMILPSASHNQSMNTQRQLSLVQAQQFPVQNQHQLSIHQPISSAQPSPAMKPISENGTATSNPGKAVAEGTPTTGTAAGPTSVSIAPKSALAPVTPASLMNLGAGSGSESTPTSSPKFGVHAKAKSGASLSSAPTSDTAAKATTNGAEPTSTVSSTASASATASASSSSGQKRGTKRQANGDMAIGSGILAPSTPRQVPLTPGSSMISPMPPPANGFSLISPALKPTLMTHRGSTSMMVSPRMQPLLVSPSLKPWLPGVSPSEAMARLASKSNYQNILDGDHTALGLSYNTDLHSGIELRRTSHKAAEQKRRDSLKNCFDDLRQMIPNIQEKSPSKVFLLKKSFDYICNLKAEVANRDLELARVKAEHEFMKMAMQAWMTTLPEDSPYKSVTVPVSAEQGDSKEEKKVSLVESWTIPEAMLKKAISRETDAAARAAELAEMSALAVEAARTQPGGQSKGGKDSQGDGEDSDDDGSGTPKAKKPANKSISVSKGGSSASNSSGSANKKASKPGTGASTPATAASSSSSFSGAAVSTSSGQSKDGDTIMEPLPPAALPLATKQSLTNGSTKAKDEKVDEDDDEDDGEDDESEDQEMTDAA